MKLNTEYIGFVRRFSATHEIMAFGLTKHQVIQPNDSQERNIN